MRSRQLSVIVAKCIFCFPMHKFFFLKNILTVVCWNVWSGWRDSSNSLGITRGSGWGRSIRGWHVVTFTHFLCWTQKRYTPKKTRTSFLYKKSPTPIVSQRKNQTASIYNRGNVVTKLMNRRAFGGRSALISRSKSVRPRSNFSSEPTVKTKHSVQCLNGRGQDAIKHCQSYIIPNATKLEGVYLRKDTKSLGVKLGERGGHTNQRYLQSAQYMCLCS